MLVLGIDIAKDTFEVVLLGGIQRYRGGFNNDLAGFTKLARWLNKREGQQVHACMEASGRYWEALAINLHKQGHVVSVVNPKVIKKHGETLMQRNKTDREDALTIADYCAKHQPDPWTPPSPARRELQAMVRYVHALKADRQRERNRRGALIPSTEVLKVIDDHIAYLDEQVAELEQRIYDHIDQHPDLKRDKELLISIPGVGDTTAVAFLAEVPDICRFPQASQLDAYAGLTPGRRESGSSIYKKGKLVKWGNPHLRAALFMPALLAHRYNPIVDTFRQRLVERGKKPMTIVIAVMRKLLHLMYGVLKNGKPFDPDYLVIAQKAT